MTHYNKHTRCFLVRSGFLVVFVDLFFGVFLMLGYLFSYTSELR